ncbi:DUF4440 domain-containing protein [Ideonella sp.]|uniref:YybH family protein n=1 Tax=Ideonella sp. TaxID=1929293 RepID=UPI0035B1B6CD
MTPLPSRPLSTRRHLLAALGLGLATPGSWAQATAAPTPSDRLRDTVMATERAFAKTMADRDLEAFQAFLSEETVFQGAQGPLRGPAAVVSAWQRFFDGPQAPFSWEPDQVLVMSDGHLALSAGPVRDPAGKLVGRFNSVWRQEAPGVWRIVLDMGNPACECARP